MPTTAQTRRNRLLIPTSIALLAVGGVGFLASGAVFTDKATVSGNTFSAGTVDISASPASAAFNVSNMVPGDLVTKPITVTNTGSLDLRYAMESTANGALAPALTLQVKAGVTDCSNIGFAATGTNLYGADALGTPTGIKVFGDKAQGPDSGDRTLAAGASEILCAQVALPGNLTGNTYQSESASATFTFNSEQTANNGADPATSAQGSGTVVAPRGTITSVATGIGPAAALSYGPNGYLYLSSADSIYKVDKATGARTAVATGFATRSEQLVYGADGYLYSANDYSGLFKVDPTTGAKTVLATGLGWVSGVAYGPDGYLYVTDGSGSLYKVDRATGAKTTVATGLTQGVEGMTETVVYGSDGYLYVTDSYSDTLLKVNPSTGAKATVATGLGGRLDALVYGPDNNLYVGNTSGYLYRVEPSTGTRIIITSAPESVTGMVYGSDGYLYITDSDDEVLYKVVP